MLLLARFKLHNLTLWGPEPGLPHVYLSWAGHSSTPENFKSDTQFSTRNSMSSNTGDAHIPRDNF